MRSLYSNRGISVENEIERIKEEYLRSRGNIVTPLNRAIGSMSPSYIRRTINITNEEFIQYCKNGDVFKVKQALQYSTIDPSYNHSRALLEAVKYNHKNIVILLVEDGRVDVMCYTGAALRISLSKGYDDIFKYLFKNVNEIIDRDILLDLYFLSVKYLKLDVVNILLPLIVIPIHLSVGNYITKIMSQVIRDDDVEPISLLIDTFPDNIKGNSYLINLLIKCAFTGAINIMKLLLHKNIIYLEDIEFKNVLIAAISGARWKSLEYILSIIEIPTIRTYFSFAFNFNEDKLSILDEDETRSHEELQDDIIKMFVVLIRDGRLGTPNIKEKVLDSLMHSGFLRAAGFIKPYTVSSNEVNLILNHKIQGINNVNIFINDNERFL